MDERWEALFADLAGELDAAEALDFDAEVRDRSEHEYALVPLAARLRAAERGPDVTVAVRGAGPIHGSVRRTGPDWVLLADPAQHDLLVPLAAVLWIAGLPAHGVLFRREEPAARLGLGSALRELARRGRPVRATLVDGTEVTGALGRVGADFLELPGGRVVPWTGLAAVRST